MTRQFLLSFYSEDHIKFLYETEIMTPVTILKMVIFAG